MKIYFARPISGRSFNEVVKYYKRITKKFAALGVETLHPMVGKEELRCEKEFKSVGYDNVPCSTNHAIFGRDIWMVRITDIVYCNLMEADEVSIGCVSEITAAAIFGKHIILAMEDNNIHQHCFPLEASHVVFKTEEGAEEYLEKLIKSTRGLV